MRTIFTVTKINNGCKSIRFFDTLLYAIPYHAVHGGELGVVTIPKEVNK